MISGKTNKSASVFFIAPAPVGISPGQRFRFEHYLPLLEREGIKYKVSSYFSMKGRKALYSNENTFGKMLAIFRGYLIRIGDLFRVMRYDYVYIHREDTPVGPPVFSWIMSRVLRRKLIYDFDDAIWIPGMSDYNRKFSFIKFFGNVAKISKWSHTVTVGNAYLKEYADIYNKNVKVIPTVVNTETMHNQVQQQDIALPAIGWTGSFSTLVYLNIILPVLQQLQEKFDFIFYVIADKDPQLPLKHYRFIKWNKDTEVQDLLNFHIGLMPLTNDQYSKGKCGFKAIQYMSLGMPAIVSPVGVNTEIVKSGEDGFICESPEEWKDKIELLLKDTLLRKKMGQAARAKIEKAYSIKATEKTFLGLFQNGIHKSFSFISILTLLV
jgi:glycosyltransferase involved in cell wall biosynthesis